MTKASPPNESGNDRISRYVSLVTFGLSLAFALAISALSITLDFVRAELVLATALGAVLISAVRGLFRTRMVPDVTSMGLRLSQSSLIAAAGVLIISEFIGQSGFGPAEFFFVLVLSLIASTMGMYVGSQTLKSMWRRGIGRSRAIVVGTGRLTDELLLELRHRRTYGVDIVGIAYPGSLDVVGPDNADLVHRRLAELADLVSLTHADRVIIGPSVDEDRELVRAARLVASQGTAVFVVPRLFEMGVGLDSLSPDRVRGYPLVRVQRSAHPRVALQMKRAFDVGVSGTAIAVLSPIMAVCALLVKTTSDGPVLFSQERIGQYGKPITVSKFRSMTGSETSDVEWTAEQRVTLVGAFLRRFSLDELPQLFSIFRGDMSLVGPRPERPAFVEKFAGEYPDYDERHRMRAGLTGLAQIVGLVGDTSIAERLKYDNLYIDQWSFGTDLQILVKTAWAVLRQPAKKREQTELARALATAPGPLPDANLEAPEGVR